MSDYGNISMYCWILSGYLVIRNNAYCENILENLLNNYQKEIPPTNILARVFFPQLRLQELLDLHKDLGRELEKVKVSYIEIGSVFEKFQDRFLVNCLVLSKMDNMKQFLADQRAENEDIRELVEKLQYEAARKELTEEDYNNKLESKEFFGLKKSQPPYHFAHHKSLHSSSIFSKLFCPQTPFPSLK